MVKQGDEWALRRCLGKDRLRDDIRSLSSGDEVDAVEELGASAGAAAQLNEQSVGVPLGDDDQLRSGGD